MRVTVSFSQGFKSECLCFVLLGEKHNKDQGDKITNTVITTKPKQEQKLFKETFLPPIITTYKLDTKVTLWLWLYLSNLYYIIGTHLV
jgi:hypothetical protein